MVEAELQKGDEFRGDCLGNIRLFRKGGNMGILASGMRITQNLEGFHCFAEKLAKRFGPFNVRPRKDPWILELE